MKYFKLIFISLKLKYNLRVLNRLKDIKEDALKAISIVDKIEKELTSTNSQ